MQNIKAIVFDLGGVLLNIDFKKVSDSFKSLGVEKFDELYSHSKADHLFENLETGKITEEEFCNAFNKHTPAPITKTDITNAWNSILLDFRMESISFLSGLKKKYKIFLLSNTNIIHFQAFNKIFEKNMINSSFNSFFDKVYYSHEIGLRKPDAAAYQYVLNENNLRANETLFIDDTIQNIEGAKAVGMPVIFFEAGMKIENIGL